MYLSNYTNIIEIDDKFFLFNARYGEIDQIDKEFLDKMVSKKISFEEISLLNERNHYMLSEQEHMNSFIKESYECRGTTSDEYNFFIMYSEKCNLKCKYCFQNGSNIKINLDRLTEIFGEIIKIKKNTSFKKYTIVIYGGEPLLEENRLLIEKTLKFSKDNDLYIKIITNGININSYMEILNEYKYILSEIIITIDGDQETHDKSRVFGNNKGTYNIILDNLETLQKLSFPVVIRINLTNDIYSQIKSKGINLLNYKKLYYRVHHNNYDQNISFEKILELYMNNKIDFDEIAVNQVKAFIYLVEENSNSPLYRFCDRSRLALFHPEHKEVFNCTENYTIDYLLKDYKFEYNNFCKECTVLPICGGGCPSEYAINNDFKYCYIYRDIINMIRRYIYIKYL